MPAQSRLSLGLAVASRGESVSAITITIDPLVPVGRRPSGARLYHRGSRFGPPPARKLDRNLIAKLLHLAAALEGATRARGKGGGVLQRSGLEVLHALLRSFYSHRDGTCYPSLEAIARAVRCCVETVRKAIRKLEQFGFLTTTRRKEVRRFVSRAERIHYDCAVQVSNGYLFNLPYHARPVHGDLGLPLLAPTKADANNWYETRIEDLSIPSELCRALASYRATAGFG